MTQTQTPTIEIPETNPNVAQPVVLETSDTEAPLGAFRAFAAIDPHTYEDRQKLLTAGVTTKQPQIKSEASSANNDVTGPTVESEQAERTADPVEASQDAFNNFAGVDGAPTPVDSSQAEGDRQKLLTDGLGTKIGNVARSGAVAGAHAIDLANPFTSMEIKNSPSEVARRQRESQQGHLEL